MLPIIVYNESFSVKDTLWVYFSFITICVNVLTLTSNCAYNTFWFIKLNLADSFNFLFFFSFVSLFPWLNQNLCYLSLSSSKRLLQMLSMSSGLPTRWQTSTDTSMRPYVSHELHWSLARQPQHLPSLPSITTTYSEIFDRNIQYAGR